MRISDWSSDVCSSDLGRPIPKKNRPTKAQNYPAYRMAILGGLAATVTKSDVANRGCEQPWAAGQVRSEERRVGKECVSRCKSRWTPYHARKNISKTKTNDESTNSKRYTITSCK